MLCIICLQMYTEYKIMLDECISICGKVKKKKEKKEINMGFTK